MGFSFFQFISSSSLLNCSSFLRKIFFPFSHLAGGDFFSLSQLMSSTFHDLTSFLFPEQNNGTCCPLGSGVRGCKKKNQPSRPSSSKRNGNDKLSSLLSFSSVFFLVCLSSRLDLERRLARNLEPPGGGILISPRKFGWSPPPKKKHPSTQGAGAGCRLQQYKIDHVLRTVERGSVWL